jgi:hypothetical protein
MQVEELLNCHTKGQERKRDVIPLEAFEAITSQPWQETMTSTLLLYWSKTQYVVSWLTKRSVGGEENFKTNYGSSVINFPVQYKALVVLKTRINISF